MKKYVLLPILSIFLFFCFCSGQVHATLVSTFDSGNDDWRVNTEWSSSLTWNSTGGNPGGYISAEENQAGSTWFFISPTTWAGNWTSYIAGTISYDIIDIEKEAWDSTFGDKDGYYPWADVIIGIDQDNMAWWPSGIAPNSANWTHYQVQLLASNFNVETNSGKTFEDIMADVHWLAIRGEYFKGDDKEGLDNVRVAPVPEPTTMLLLGTGLIGLAGFRRKFKNRTVSWVSAF